MTPQQTSRILVLLSIAFGGTIGILATLNSSAVGIVAAIGGIVLGLLWVTRSFFTKDPN
jgi:membrane associated rhomboid family serine protease